MMGQRVLVACVLSASLLAGCTSSLRTHKLASPHLHHHRARRYVGLPVPPTGPHVPLPPNFYGVNFDLAGFMPFARSDTGALLAALEPSTIRWPGGTEADFYDWHNGLDTQKPTKVTFTLQDLAAAYRATGAIPIFDLNVLASDNATNPSDQIAMLKAAQQLGLPIDYVEIGNELYSNAPGVPQAFPDGSSYARTVSIYVRALRRAFPGVKIAADTIPFPEDKREMSWDAQLLAGLNGTNAPDAFIVHFYPGLYQNPFHSSDLAALFENIYNSLTELSQAVQHLGGKPVWLTEYNMRGPYQIFRKMGVSPAEHDYAHELYLAAFAAMLPRVRGLALVDCWTAFADGFYGAWQDPTSPFLTPAGQAIEMVDSVAKEATMAQTILVPGVPELPNGEPGVVGERFMGTGKSGAAILVNLTSETVSLPAGGWLVFGSRYEQVTGDPTVAKLAAPIPAIGIVGEAGLSLPPYSLTIIGRALASPWE